MIVNLTGSQNTIEPYQKQHYGKTFGQREPV